MAKKQAGSTPAPKQPNQAPAAAQKPRAGKAASAKNEKQATKEELFAKVCDLIAMGHSLRQIAAMDGMPAVATVMRWLADESATDFREQYARAREVQAETIADEILEIADEECITTKADRHGVRPDDDDGNVEVVFDSVAVQRNRLRVDARKWLLAKLAPKKYGDKVMNEHTGANGGAIQVQSTVTFVRAPGSQEQK